MLSKFCSGIRYALSLVNSRALTNGRDVGSFSKMVGITATWFLVGCALGLRFKVLVLVPAVTLAMLAATVVGIARGDQFWSVVVAVILFGTAVQFGYLAGIVTRDGIASIRAHRRKFDPGAPTRGSLHRR
jgi:hypothetical protein